MKDFETFYSSLYGKRWPALRAAMVPTPKKAALWNRFCQVPFSEVTRGLARVDETSITQAFQRPPAGEGDNGTDGAELIDKPPIDEFGVKAYYLIDYASACVVEQLQVGPFDTVLDLCAAPGGKSIAAAQFLSPDGSITSNEARADRCTRLRRNLQEHVPPSYVPWRVVQRDAQTWHDPAAYTRVLVDAPCSSERHLLHQSGGGQVSLREWSEESTKAMAALQCSLLQRAFETCSEGGRVVYSTCSISPYENDGVVTEALRRTRCEVRVVTPGSVPVPGVSEAEVAPSGSTSSVSPTTSQSSAALGEPTTYGRLLLPDVFHGWGPMYFAVFEKVAQHRRCSSSSDDSDDEG